MKKLASAQQISLVIIALLGFQLGISQTKSINKYDVLVSLFKEWRAFEKPPLQEGAPDYTAETFEKRWPEFKKLQTKLLAMEVSDWPVEQQVDWN